MALLWISIIDLWPKAVVANNDTFTVARFTVGIYRWSSLLFIYVQQGFTEHKLYNILKKPN